MQGGTGHTEVRDIDPALENGEEDPEIDNRHPDDKVWARSRVKGPGLRGHPNYVSCGVGWVGKGMWREPGSCVSW